MLSDKLACALRIIIEDIGNGYWRFPEEKEVRESEKKENSELKQFSILMKYI
ncbi:MAG: hypothetical protein QMD12_00840 [Candidatus Aenigmarchaeota archaeon]|nr:hypothetical protein [Candidatus Aenigmarchaeota archaeon]